MLLPGVGSCSGHARRSEYARKTSKKVAPNDYNTYVGRCRYQRADGSPYWRPAHFELPEDVGNLPAHLLPPLFNPYLVKWLGSWQIFAGWVIASKGDVTHEHRQLWAIARDLGESGPVSK